MDEKGKNAIAAIAGIVILTILALFWGYDGVLFALAVGIISGLGGYPLAKELFRGLLYDLEGFRSIAPKRK